MAHIKWNPCFEVQLTTMEIIRSAHPFGATLRVFYTRKLACAAALRASR